MHGKVDRRAAKSVKKPRGELDKEGTGRVTERVTGTLYGTDWKRGRLR